MRLTELRYAQHIGRMFKVRWLVDARSKVPDTGAEAFLASKGIEVVKPNDILTPPFPLSKAELDPLPVTMSNQEPETSPCFVFTDRYSAPGGVPQIQHLTNSIVHPSLPQPLLSQVTENTEEEDERVKEAILHAHCLDSYQEKLPKIIDITKLDRNPPREYGSPVRRINKSLSYQLILLLDQLFPEANARHLADNVKLQVMFNRLGRLMQLQHTAAFLLSSPTPILSPFTKGEPQIDYDTNPLPDIHPISPFLHCQERTNYSQEEFYSVTSRRVYYPHTVFIHLNIPRMRDTDDTFSARTLIKAFSHAAAYAKLCKKVENGDLQEPVVLNIIHTNGRKYHLGVFQLNTLDLTGPTKNIFWSHPLEDLFETCQFKVAKATLEGYNPRVFSLLKVLHMQ